MIGREAALVELEWLLGSVRTFGRTHLDLWVATEGDGIFALFAELELEWASSEPRPALVPCVVIVRAREGLIEDIRFYLDLGSR